MSSNDTEITLSEICSRFQMEDPLGFLHEIYHIVAGVYDMNSQRHDETVGDDMATYAQLIYRNSWSQLELTLPLFSYDIWASRPKNSLVIHTPGPDVKVYRGGSDQTFDIELYDFETGSITKQVFARSNDTQLNLFDHDHQLDASDLDRRLAPDGWVIVHSGNPNDGLLNMWIGAPRTPTETDDSTWSFVCPLPNLCQQYGCGGSETTGGLSVEPSPHGPSGPSFDALPEPEIHIEPKIDHG